MLRRMWGSVGAFWGIGGVALLLGSAVWRLTPIAVAAFDNPLSWRHLAFLVPWVVVMLWSEGYRGFHQQFCPRVVARARHLHRHPRFWHVLFAPPFCMGYFHATLRRMMSSLLLTLGIVILVLIVGRMPQPWRGLIDIGVVVGLAMGLASLAYFTVRGFVLDDLEASPELPYSGAPSQE